MNFNSEVEKPKIRNTDAVYLKDSTPKFALAAGSKADDTCEVAEEKEERGIGSVFTKMRQVTSDSEVHNSDRNESDFFTDFQ